MKYRSRKQKLEEDFKREDAERSQFYQNNLIQSSHHQSQQQLQPQKSPQVSSFSTNQTTSSNVYSHSTMTVQRNSTQQFYNHPPMGIQNIHISPTSSLTKSHHNHNLNNLTFSSSESNFAFGTNSLSGGFNQSAGHTNGSSLHKNDF